GVQFASKMGFETIAIARGPDKADFARQMGAHHYVDSTAQDVAGELNRLGGARARAGPAADAPPLAAPPPRPAAPGRLGVPGGPQQPMPVLAGDLIGACRSVIGHASGTSMDSEDTLRFASLAGVRPVIEVFPLERAPEAYERMLSGHAHFRVVLTTR